MTRLILPTLLVLLYSSSPSYSQKPPPPPKPNPKAPLLNAPTPNGMQRGTKRQITLTGKNMASPTGVWTSFPAKVTIPTDKSNGTFAGKLHIVLEVPDDAPMGYHLIRLATTQGMSNAQLFCIDSLPEIKARGGNNSIDQAQKIAIPCVVEGSIDPEKSDFYQFSVKAGQRLSFEAIGRRLGTVVDPQISLYEAGSGREVPGAHNNDAKGLQTDPRLTWTFPDAGEYIVGIRDVLYRGSPAYRYRLRIGDFPCAIAPYPMAQQRGTKSSIAFSGPLAQGAPPLSIEAPKDQTVAALQIAPRFSNGPQGWPVSLRLSDHPEQIENEPNDDPTKATRMAVPSGMSGRFLKKGDVDHFVFAAKKGQKLTLEAQTFELFSAAEVYMRILDGKGKQLMVTDPAKTPKLTFTPPAHGDYTLVAEHLHYWHGPTEAYRIVIKPIEPGFSISVALDRFDAPPGGTFSVPIMVSRSGYNGPIEVSVVGTSTITGKVTIPAGQPKKANFPGATLKMTMASDAKPGPVHFRIQATATINKKPVVRYATIRPLINALTGNLPYPPPHLLSHLAAAVRPK